MTLEKLDKWIDRLINLVLLALAFSFGVFLFVGMMGCGIIAISLGVIAYVFAAYSLVNEWIELDELATKGV